MAKQNSEKGITPLNILLPVVLRFIEKRKYTDYLVFHFITAKYQIWCTFCFYSIEASGVYVTPSPVINQRIQNSTGLRV